MWVSNLAVLVVLASLAVLVVVSALALLVVSTLTRLISALIVVGAGLVALTGLIAGLLGFALSSLRVCCHALCGSALGLGHVGTGLVSALVVVGAGLVAALTGLISALAGLVAAGPVFVLFGRCVAAFFCGSRRLGCGTDIAAVCWDGACSDTGSFALLFVAVHCSLG